MDDNRRGHLTTDRKSAAEIIAREMGKAVHPWSLSYKPRVQWPADYTPEERKKLEEGAWAVIAALEAAGLAIKCHYQPLINLPCPICTAQK